MKRYLGLPLLLVFTLLATACAPAATPAAGNTRPATPATQAERLATPFAGAPSPQVSAPAAPAQPETVAITAADGLKIVGTFYPGSGSPPWPGVLLLHILGSNRGAWAGFAGQLAQKGYAALAIDMRGQGDTGGQMDWKQAPDDIQRAWAYISARPDVDPARTAIVGASIGANLALITGVAEPDIRTVVLLSPGLDYQGVSTQDAMPPYGERPVLIVASQEDTYAANSSARLRDLARGKSQLELYDGAGHGTAMLSAKPELAGLILDWLGQTLR